MKPWLWIPPDWAHTLSPYVLPLIAQLYGQQTPRWKALSWRGLEFANPLGIAGGVDKNATQVKQWWQLGCGFVEVGTVTPRPQGPNPGRIMDRDLALGALWNKMGFPSAGAEKVLKNLKKLPPHHTPVLVNIGKNRETPLEQAVHDYLKCIQQLHSESDAFVINISSPNTQGLRDLQKRENLQSLLSPCLELGEKLNKNILLKLSPDLEPEELARVLTDCSELGIRGFILTNTTLARPKNCHFPNEGGLSGKPLASLSKQALNVAVQTLGNAREKHLLISAGGVMSPEDVHERLQLGADLVQIYSALIFHGPQFFHDVARRKHD